MKHKSELYKSAAQFLTLGLIGLVALEAGVLASSYFRSNSWFGLALFFSVLGLATCFGGCFYFCFRALRTRPDSKFFGESEDI